MQIKIVIFRVLIWYNRVWKRFCILFLGLSKRSYRMFYEITDKLNEITIEQLNSNKPSVGIIKSDELTSIGRRLGFDEETIEASQKANPVFRTGVDVRDDYTFAELRIVNPDGHEDFVSLYIRNNFLLIVDIVDEDSSTINSFLRAINRCTRGKVCVEKIIWYFMEALLSNSNKIAEELRDLLADLEESIVNKTADEDLNIELLNIKKRILKHINYYGQIMDITEELEENDNEILDEDDLIYITNLTNKVSRLKDDMNSLSSMADHIQDTYSTFLDQKLNNTMKVFTIITTIFFPLTIIVGWYGMNFNNMPELAWKYGYLYVIVLSVITILALLIVGKVKKWFK